MADNDDEDDIEHLYLEARRVYLSGDYTAALRLNERLRDVAKAQGASAIELIGHRFVGLCHYRLDQLGRSAESFNRALALATAMGCKSQELLITNHLCSTLRRQGIYDEAVDRFEAAIEQADAHRFLHERCRLLGNYGALLDELGQRAQADDCYARFEELAQLLGKSDRLANARGLAARAAVLRGDIDVARTKLRDEARLAQEAGNVSRALAASIHVARLLPSSESIHELEIILNGEPLKSSVSRRIDANIAIADAQTKDGQLSSAWRHYRDALAICGEKGTGDDSHWEKRAMIHEHLAGVTQRSGLHGEALHYLRLVVNERHEKYEPFRRNDRIRRMAQTRLASLGMLAERLVDEAFAAMCDQEEKESIAKLIGRVNGSSDGLTWDDVGMLRAARRRGKMPTGERVKDAIGRESEARWRLLLGEDFSKLHKDTRDELITSEIAYSSEVDDLARSAQCLAVEMELVHRLLPTRSERLGLGEILNEVRDSSDTSGRHRRGGKGRKGGNDRYQPLRDRLRRSRLDFAPLLQLITPISSLDGQEVILGALRNDLVHGRKGSLSRLTVDAIKRRLVLEPTEGNGPPVLRYLATLTLP